MCLRFVFLLITRVITWLRLSRREETWKTAEILLLRHQVTVPQRHQACRPKLNRADRVLLATLPGVIPRPPPAAAAADHPRARSCAGGAASSSGAGRRGPCAAGPAGHPLGHQGPRPPADLGNPDGVLQDPRGAGRAGSQGRSVHCMGDPQDQRNRPIPATGRAGLVTIPALPGRRDLASDFFAAGLLDGTQAHVLAVVEHMRPGASASSASRRIPPGSGPPSRPATSSWTSLNRPIGPSS